MATGGNEKNFPPQRFSTGYKDRLLQRRIHERTVSADLVRKENTKSVCNLSDTILNGFEVLWRQNLMCDLVLTSQTKAFQVHKILLVTCSDYFYDLFVEKKYSAKETDFSDIKPDVLEGILECMYTGKIHLTDGNTESVLAAASKLGFFNVKDVCEEFLVSTATLKNCLRMLDIAFRFSLNNLCDTSLEISAKSYKLISRRSRYKELPVDQIMALLKRDDLAADDELEVFRCMLMWIDHDRVDRLEHAAHLMTAVRLPLLPASVIVDSVESVEYLMNIPECQNLVKEALHYHCMPARQSVLQSSRTLPRKPVHQPCLLISGGAPRLMRESVSDDIYRYSFLEERWETVSTIPGERHHHAVAVLGGFLYVAGGERTNNHKSPENTVYRYDPRTNAWLAVASMKYKRQSFQLVALNGMLYAIGGRMDKNESLDIVERYNPNTDKWEEVAPLCSPKRCVAAAVLNGRIYVVGGSGDKMVSSKVERYHPAENKWQTRKPLTIPRFFPQLVQVKGSLLVIGGATINSEGTISCVEAVEKYSPTADTWKFVCNMLTPRAEFGCCMLDDVVYVAGGYNWNNGERLTSVESLDLDTMIWTSVSNISRPLTGIACCTLTLYFDRSDREAILMRKSRSPRSTNDFVALETTITD
ncbi:KLHL31 [Mytilus coruscus]|uniref:KLHL31 n=1 Tax=Mytilus coruscus TaxID=42192 RepID=A0A6J8DUK2_MYTCO|nr:KLHL31 [Mytilus coruscus]